MALPSVAGAATATASASYSPASGLTITGAGQYTLLYVGSETAASPVIRVEREPGINHFSGQVTVDPTPFSGGAGCSPKQFHSPFEFVDCQMTGAHVVTANLGPNDDRFAACCLHEIDMFVNGAGGADVITTGRGFDSITGGPGADTLDGKAGNDTLSGGDGADILNGGTGINTLNGEDGDDTFLQPSAPANTFGADLGSDAINGGAGIDTADYSSRSVAQKLNVGQGGADDGVFVTVRAATGEGDTIGSDVEVAVGGSGDDDIAAVGTGSTVLRGGNGNDQLSATLAATFDPGLGADTVTGGSRNDTILARDAVADNIRCGDGSDTITIDLRDTLAPESACESIDRDAIKEGPNLRIAATTVRVPAHGSARLRLSCPRALGTWHCYGTVAARSLARGTNGPKTSYRLRPGQSRVVDLRLRSSDRARARRSGGVLRVTAVDRGRFGAKTTVRTLRARRA